MYVCMCMCVTLCVFCCFACMGMILPSALLESVWLQYVCIGSGVCSLGDYVLIGWMLILSYVVFLFIRSRRLNWLPLS